MPFSTNTATHSAGQVNETVRTLVSTAATAEDTTFGNGFVPRYVCIENLTDRIKHEWYEGMAADSALKTIAAGTRTLETSGTLTVYTTSASAQAAGKQLGDVVIKAAVLVASKSFRLITRA